MTTEHLKCEYLLIWMRNMQNCEMPKNDIFSQVRGHEKLLCFWLSENLLKWWESPPFDHRTLEMWKYAHLDEKYAKLWNAQIYIFRLFEKAHKTIKITPSWPQNTCNVNICSFGWEICEVVKCAKMTIFRRSAVMKVFIFLLSVNSSKMMKIITRSPQDIEMWIFAHLDEKYAKMWNAQIDIFFAGLGSWRTSIFSTFWKGF